MYSRSRGVTLSRSAIALAIASRARICGSIAAPVVERATAHPALGSGGAAAARPPFAGSRSNWNAGR